MTRFVAALAFALCLVAAQAHAATSTFSLAMDGLQVVPPNASPAFGQGTVTLDTITNVLSFDVAFQDLLGGSTAVSLHGNAGPGTNAPTLYTLNGLFPAGATSGLISGNLTLTDPSLFGGMSLATQLNGLNSDNWYLVVHSQVFPGGEIRGQLILEAVPEPASLTLLALPALALIRRRRA